MFTILQDTVLFWVEHPLLSLYRSHSTPSCYLSTSSTCVLFYSFPFCNRVTHYWMVCWAITVSQTVFPRPLFPCIPNFIFLFWKAEKNICMYGWMQCTQIVFRKCSRMIPGSSPSLHSYFKACHLVLMVRMALLGTSLCTHWCWIPAVLLPCSHSSCSYMYSWYQFMAPCCWKEEDLLFSFFPWLLLSPHSYFFHVITHPSLAVAPLLVRPFPQPAQLREKTTESAQLYLLGSFSGVFIS